MENDIGKNFETLGKKLGKLGIKKWIGKKIGKIGNEKVRLGKSVGKLGMKKWNWKKLGITLGKLGSWDWENWENWEIKYRCRDASFCESSTSSSRSPSSSLYVSWCDVKLDNCPE